MQSFKKGETPVFKFVPNVDVDGLGDPKCVLKQGDTTMHLETSIDVESNALLCYLSKENSLSLVGGFPAWLQHIWTDDNGNVIAFPMQQVFVEETYIQPPDVELPVDVQEEDEGEAVEDEDFINDGYYDNEE